MKRSMMTTILVGMTVVILVAGGTQAADYTDLFTVAGQTTTVQGGYPWNLPETNFHYEITTNGVDGRQGVNAGDGTFNEVREDLQIANWRNFNAYSSIRIAGSIPAGGLSDLDDASADQVNWTRGSWVTVGLISKNQALRAADWYLSGMFNNSVMVGFQNWGGEYSAFAEDTAGDGNTQVLVFDPSLALSYELTIDTVAKTASLRIDNGSGWSSPVSHAFSADNWGWGDPYNDNLGESAFIAQSYGFDASGATTITLGDITVSAVPEPATMCLLAVGGIGMLIRRRRAAR